MGAFRGMVPALWGKNRKLFFTGTGSNMPPDAPIPPFCRVEEDGRWVLCPPAGWRAGSL